MEVEQMMMERFTQPSGTVIKLRLLEIQDTGSGYPYVVERCIGNQVQQGTYNLTY